MKLFFALGPGDIVNDIRRVQHRCDSSGETSITFSEQVYRYASLKSTSALLVSHHERRDAITVDTINVINLPKIWSGRSGIAFHASQIAYGLTLAVRAMRFGADVAIVDSGSTHPFILILFRLLGIRTALNFHNVRWPIGFEPKGFVARTVRALDSLFFRFFSAGALGCSPECGRQARTDGADNLPFFEWRGQYAPEGFDPHRPDRTDAAFRIMFAGRVEEPKGVFDLLEIAPALAARITRPVAIHVCGDGSALQELRAKVAERQLGALVNIKGRLERTELLQEYHEADVVIVPTRGNFCEGMPLVCAEAMLAGRPVVTSRLSNALPIMGDAIAEVHPESVTGYVDALALLANDANHYERLQAACHPASLQFLDPAQSYYAAIERFIGSASGKVVANPI